MSTAELASHLDLPGLAAEIRCLTGLPECRCAGCVAAAAIVRADDHLKHGELLDADIAIGNAAFVFPWGPVEDAARTLSAALAEVTP